MEVQVCLNQDVVSSKPRTGEVLGILPDGTHIDPGDVARWIDDGVVPNVPKVAGVEGKGGRTG